MRFILPALFLTLQVLTASAAEQFREPEGFPKLHLKSITMPGEKLSPLELTVELTAVGKSPIAVSQAQFSVHLSPDSTFIADAKFPADSPKVFTVPSGKTLSITLTVAANRHGRGERWSELRPGKHTVKVYLNSGKDREFDYQFLGQTYSEPREIEIK